jgi:small subunit ribosomal protein S1
MSASFEQCLDENLSTLVMKPGSLVTGIVLDILDNHVVVHVGLKSEAAVPINEFNNESGELDLKVGDEVQLTLEAIEDGHGNTRVSREKAIKQEVWKRIEDCLDQDTSLKGLITGSVKGGMTVDVQGIKSFLPGSLAEVIPTKDLEHLVGNYEEFKVIKLDKEKNNVVLSRKAVLQDVNSEERKQLLSTLSEGQTIKGVVKNLTVYGAFVDLGGIDGLLHITDISWSRINHPSEAIKIGEELDVRVIKYDKEEQKVSLGIKQLVEDPWVGIESKFPLNTSVMGTVTNLTDYGFFAEIEEGVEGLVHVSEIDWTNKNIHPSKVVQLKDKVEVMILEVDSEKRRVSLGIKQCLENPWKTFSQNFSTDEKIKGTIKSITDFGIFIGLPGNIDGLIHISDTSWDNENTINLSEYEKGTEIEAVILSIDPQRQRISLGIKQLQNDPFTVFKNNNSKGKIVNGVATEIDESNALVQIDGSIKGLLNISEVSQGRIQDVRTVIKSGDEIEAKIIGFDNKNRTVKLSIKAKEETEEREAVESYKADESESIAKTSLGDLLKSKFTKKDSSE